MRRSCWNDRVTSSVSTARQAECTLKGGLSDTTCEPVSPTFFSARTLTARSPGARQSDGSYSARARIAARHCAPVRYRVSLSEPDRRMHRSFHGACAQTDRLCVIERNCSAPGQVQGDAVCRPANIYTRRGRYERVDLRPSRTVNGRHHLPGPCSKSAVVYVSHGEGDRTRRSRVVRLIQKASVMPVPAGGSRYAGRATSSSCL